MEQLAIKRHIWWIYGMAFFLFVINKFMFRPWVLTQDDSFHWLKIIAWSLPNFAEAVIGSIVVTGLLCFLKIRFLALPYPLQEKSIFPLAILLVTVYVLTQEIKWHNLGGRNVYDPNDFIASILGLLFMLTIFYSFGFRNANRAAT